MEPLRPHDLANALLSAPGWARVGLTAPSEHLRQQAAEELALAIVDHLDPKDEQDPRQLPLFR